MKKIEYRHSKPEVRTRRGEWVKTGGLISGSEWSGVVPFAKKLGVTGLETKDNLVG